jgi:cobaltochelatase CobT
LGELSGDAIPQGLTVTILVDMSGSSFGRPISQTCYGVLAATLALEQVGASVEVLGYTTTGSTGPIDAFNTDRSVTVPGRLSALLHVIAKEAGVPAAGAAGSILAMATNGLHRENLDGEALIWAARRLVARPGSEKVLVLVTDGWEPICGGSERFARSGDRDFMKRHLKAVVEEIEAQDELGFAQVVLSEPWGKAEQDTYTAPVIGRAEAPEVAAAIGEALARVLVPAVPMSLAREPAVKA